MAKTKLKYKVDARLVKLYRWPTVEMLAMIDNCLNFIQGLGAVTPQELFPIRRNIKKLLQTVKSRDLIPAPKKRKAKKK